MQESVDLSASQPRQEGQAPIPPTTEVDEGLAVPGTNETDAAPNMGEGEIVLSSFAKLAQNRREKKIKKLENRQSFRKSLVEAAMDFTALRSTAKRKEKIKAKDISPLTTIYEEKPFPPYKKPRGLRQRLVEQRVTKAADKLRTNKRHLHSVKTARKTLNQVINSSAEQMARAISDVPIGPLKSEAQVKAAAERINRRVFVTKQWRREQTAGLKQAFKDRTISKHEYRKQKKIIKKREYRLVDENERYLRPRSKFERKLERKTKRAQRRINRFANPRRISDRVRKARINHLMNRAETMPKRVQKRRARRERAEQTVKSAASRTATAVKKRLHR